MPSSNPHLVLRTSIWHCRIDIPADLRPAYGNRRILSKSLKTGDKLLARELAAVQAGQWKAEFRRIRDAKLRAGDRWREAVHDESKRLEAARNAMFLRTMQNSPPDTPSEIGRDQLKQLIDNLAADKRYDLLTEFRDLMSEGCTPETEAIWVQRYSRWMDKVVHHRATSQHLLDERQSAEAFTLIKDPASYKPKSPISATAQDRFAAFLSEQNDNERTRKAYLSHIKRFSTWMTTNGKTLTFDSVVEYLDSVSKARQTRQVQLAALSKFHKWAVRYEPYYRELMTDTRSPFEGHEHPKKGENAGHRWLEYSKQEAEKLHAAATAKGDTDLADLIAFACYTGCRIEELGRIRKETTIFDDAGIPVGFRVDESKTKSGIREIPLHPALTPIYLRRLEQPHGKGEYLFPGNDKTSLRLNGLSQRFSKLKRSEGFGDLHVFHSFRKTTATLLHQAGASPLTIPFILGHGVGNITFDVYSAGPSFEQKLEALGKLKFNFGSPSQNMRNNLINHP